MNHHPNKEKQISYTGEDAYMVDSQLQQCPVRIGVGKSVLALVAHVFLEITHSLGVISLKAIYDTGDLIGALLGVFGIHFRCG